MRTFATRCSLLSAIAVCCAVHKASAAPTINSLSLRGLQVGARTTLVIDGSELGPETKILLTSPIAEQSVKPGATPQHVEVEIALDASVPAGLALLRVGSASGVSNAVAVGLDTLPQQAFVPQAAALPVAMSGNLTGNAVLTTTFAGKKGQRVVVDAEARRLGSLLNPMLHLLDPRRVQIAWSATQPALEGDARCEAVLPADGDYTIEVHDMVYRGADPGFFRLKIGELNYADVVYPLGVQQGASTEVQPVASSFAGVKIPLSIGDLGVQPAPWPPNIALLTGARPGVIVSSHPEVLETPQASGQVQVLPAAPVAVSGRLDAPNQDDRYRLPVTPNTALRFDVLAMRAGSPVDGVLSILKEDGAALASSDDRPGTSDPGMDVTVPGDVNAVILSLRDLRGLGGTGNVYRIAVTSVAQPDFRLSIDDRQNVPVAGASLLRVRAERNNYAGPIKLSLPGLPAGVTATGLEIPQGATQAIVTLTAAAPAPQTLISLVGESDDPQIKISHSADVPENAVTRQHPWLRKQFAVATGGAPTLQLAWEAPVAAADLKLGMPLPAKVKLTRSSGVMGQVRLSLVTTQVIPKKTMKVNNVDQQVDDLDKALRLENPPTLADGQGDSDLKILVPADLPAIPYDLAVQAELLAADGKTVTATATTPALRLKTVQ